MASPRRVSMTGMTMDSPCYLPLPDMSYDGHGPALLGTEPAFVFESVSLRKPIASNVPPEGRHQERSLNFSKAAAGGIPLPPGLGALKPQTATMGSLPTAAWSDVDEEALVSDESESVSDDVNSPRFQEQQEYHGYCPQQQHGDHDMQRHVQSLTMAAQKYELVAQQQSIRQQQEKLDILRRQLAASLARLNVASAPQVVAAPMHHQRAAPTLSELPAMQELHHHHHPGAPAANNAGCLHRQKESDNTSTEVTLMMGSLSSKYTQQSLLEEIDMHGFAGTYDFFYLPIDAATKTNRAYAFINLTSGEAAKRFQEIFDGHKMRLPNSSKCTTVKVAALQGFEANHAHFANSRVANRGNVHSRPLFLREVTSSRSFNNNSMKKSRNAAVRAGKYAQSKAVMQEMAPSPIKKANGTRETSFCPFCGVPKGATFQFCVNCRASF